MATYRITCTRQQPASAAPSHQHIVAVGTSVVRALESAANADGTVRVGNGVASGRIRRNAPIHVVDAILTGVHRPGESHFELLEAFADDPVLAKISEAITTHGYRPHEFGDSMLIERRARVASRDSNTELMSREASVPVAI